MGCLEGLSCLVFLALVATQWFSPAPCSSGLAAGLQSITVHFAAAILPSVLMLLASSRSKAQQEQQQQTAAGVHDSAHSTNPVSKTLLQTAVPQQRAGGAAQLGQVALVSKVNVSAGLPTSSCFSTAQNCTPCIGSSTTCCGSCRLSMDLSLDLWRPRSGQSSTAGRCSSMCDNSPQNTSLLCQQGQADVFSFPALLQLSGGSSLRAAVPSAISFRSASTPAATAAVSAGQQLPDTVAETIAAQPAAVDRAIQQEFAAAGAVAEVMQETAPAAAEAESAAIAAAAAAAGQQAAAASGVLKAAGLAAPAAELSVGAAAVCFFPQRSIADGVAAGSTVAARLHSPPSSDAASGSPVIMGAAVECRKGDLGALSSACTTPVTLPAAPAATAARPQAQVPAGTTAAAVDGVNSCCSFLAAPTPTKSLLVQHQTVLHPGRAPQQQQQQQGLQLEGQDHMMMQHGSPQLQPDVQLLFMQLQAEAHVEQKQQRRKAGRQQLLMAADEQLEQLGLLEQPALQQLLVGHSFDHSQQQLPVQEPQQEQEQELAALCFPAVPLPFIATSSRHSLCIRQPSGKFSSTGSGSISSPGCVVAQPLPSPAESPLARRLARGRDDAGFPTSPGLVELLDSERQLRRGLSLDSRHSISSPGGLEQTVPWSGLQLRPVAHLLHQQQQQQVGLAGPGGGSSRVLERRHTFSTAADLATAATAVASLEKPGAQQGATVFGNIKSPSPSRMGTSSSECSSPRFSSASGCVSGSDAPHRLSSCTLATGSAAAAAECRSVTATDCSKGLAKGAAEAFSFSSRCLSYRELLALWSSSDLGSSL